MKGLPCNANSAPMRTRKPQNIPFDFIFDYLYPLEVEVKPMFGMFAIYAGEKILCCLCKRDKHPEANGVWVATTKEHYKSLKKDLPLLQPFVISSGKVKEAEWQLLPEEVADFEKQVIQLCELIKRRDPRIGKIPVGRKK